MKQATLHTDMGFTVKRLNNQGIAHHAIVALFVVVTIGTIGAYRVFFSHAEVLSSSKRTCYSASNLAGAKIEGHSFHKTGTQTYAFEDSPAGIKYAAKHNYDSIDLDVQVTSDGVPVVVHWSDPLNDTDIPDTRGKEGWYNDGGFFSASSKTKVKDMSFKQISSLKNKDGVSRVYSLAYMLTVIEDNKINLVLDVKASLSKDLPEITKDLNKRKIKTVFKGNPTDHKYAKDTLADARRYGFWTRGTEYADKKDQGWKAPGSSCN